jgi:hypothetical protein
VTHDTPATGIQTDRLSLLAAHPSHAGFLQTYLLQNRDFVQPWEPSRTKTRALDAVGAQQVSGFFVALTPDQCNNLMAGFFRIYTNDSSLPLARDNVQLLAP